MLWRKDEPWWCLGPPRTDALCIELDEICFEVLDRGMFSYPSKQGIVFYLGLVFWFNQLLDHAR